MKTAVKQLQDSNSDTSKGGHGQRALLAPAASIATDTPAPIPVSQQRTKGLVAATFGNSAAEKGHALLLASLPACNELLSSPTEFSQTQGLHPSGTLKISRQDEEILLICWIWIPRVVGKLKRNKIYGRL